ncbi:hypothetical protein D9758_010595 [Tetrapyrgos nigripes]|uniref:NADP-dependent oxidoreductase domain-containing protein n=1 Tax=Tetrapyrgos nigripes TaxID=182062 RepID=A0A8H5D6X6_9AGAR|nr:hypothetical protein D9758_010595 [Tetrapyrgos nigripes]
MAYEVKSMEVLKAVWDRGINTIDTTNAYSNGKSERAIGKFIKKYQIPHNEILILTKCHHLVHKDIGFTAANSPELSNTRDYVNQFGLFRAAIFHSVEASLRRLDTPYIDLLQIHRFDPNVEPEETIKALHDLVQSGKFALLNLVAERNGWTKFVSMQNECSLLYREEERDFAYCNYHGLIPWAPNAGGRLTRPLEEKTTRAAIFKGTPYYPDATDADKRIIKRVQEIAEKHGKSMAQIASAWVC